MFPRSILEDHDVKAFIDAYEIQGGFVGENLWHRGMCGSFVVTEEQRAQAAAELNDPDYGGGKYDLGGPDTVAVIYGDEYESIASELSAVLSVAARRMGIGSSGGFDYN